MILDYSVGWNRCGCLILMLQTLLPTALTAAVVGSASSEGCPANAGILLQSQATQTGYMFAEESNYVRPKSVGDSLAGLSFLQQEGYSNAEVDIEQDFVVTHLFQRLGNNLAEMTAAILLAEALGVHRVKFEVDKRDNGTVQVRTIMNLPQDFLHIDPNPGLQSRTNCKAKVRSGRTEAILFPPCTGFTNDDERAAAQKYLTPLLKDAARSCNGAQGKSRDLVVHLRSGDVMMIEEPFTQRLISGCNRNFMECAMAPCGFLDYVIGHYNFQSILVVTEPDMAHPCLGTLKSRHEDIDLQIRSNTIEEAACEIVHARRLALGSWSTFSMTLAYLNPNLKELFVPWPSCKRGQAGLAAPLKTISFEVQGFNIKSTKPLMGKEKLKYMLNTNRSAVSVGTECSGLHVNSVPNPQGIF